MQTKILCVCGSSRRDSLNQKLLEIAALGATQEGGAATHIRLRDGLLQPGLGSTQRMDPRESNRANGSVLKQAMGASMNTSSAPMIEERWQKTREGHE